MFLLLPHRLIRGSGRNGFGVEPLPSQAAQPFVNDNYCGFQLRVQERGAFGVRRALAALVFTQRKAARARRTPNAPRRRAAYPFRKGCRLISHRDTADTEFFLSPSLFLFSISVAAVAPWPFSRLFHR